MGNMESCICETTTVTVNITDALGLEQELICPQYNECCGQLLNNLSFWMEGVVQVSFAITGILSNFVSCLILASKEMRNAFNLLLIALSLFDCCYLFGSILESFRKCFELATSVHILLFPYLLYPGQMIMMTASVFMTVAISMERYAAVHYPLDYNFAMNDERASFRRLLKYVIPVISFAITFNIPKFFEATLGYGRDNNPYIKVTALRTNPDYAIYYNNWARLAVLGIVPAALLVFFNTKIYQDIRVRRARRCPQKLYSSTIIEDPPAETKCNDGTKRGEEIKLSILSKKRRDVGDNGEDTNKTQGQKVVVSVHGAEQTSREQNSENEESAKITKVSFVSQASAQSGTQNTSPLSQQTMVLNGNTDVRKQHTVVVPPSSPTPMTPPPPNRKVGRAGSVNRRRHEDNLAMIFMGIVLVFLLCHFPRVFLGLHEMLIAKQSIACLNNGKDPFPFWALIVTNFSHLLLVLNSSVNSIIYCMLSSKFRVAAVRYFQRINDNLDTTIKNLYVVFGIRSREEEGGAGSGEHTTHLQMSKARTRPKVNAMNENQDTRTLTIPSEEDGKGEKY